MSNIFQRKQAIDLDTEQSALQLAQEAARGVYALTSAPGAGFVTPTEYIMIQTAMAQAEALTRIAAALEQQNTAAWGIRTPKAATGPELVPVDAGSVGILYRTKAEG